MKKRKLNDFEICNMALQMLEENKTCLEMASIYGVTDYTVYTSLMNYLPELDKVLFLRIKKLMKQHKRRESESEKNEFYKLIDGMLCKEISKTKELDQCKLKI